MDDDQPVHASRDAVDAVAAEGIGDRLTRRIVDADQRASERRFVETVDDDTAEHGESTARWRWRWILRGCR
jgi:hypothetical protein